VSRPVVTRFKPRTGGNPVGPAAFLDGAGKNKGGLRRPEELAR
jgi:hypothetical protein